MRLDKESMSAFMQSYDVLKQKYFWDMDNIPATLMKQIVLSKKRCYGAEESWDYEKAKNTYLTVRDVYDDEMKDYLGILQIALEKFLGDFVNIEGIEQLFTSSYFDFEWLMHLEYSSDKHDYIRYRDHYIHQIKNMYEMLVLLDEYGYMDYCIRAYQSGLNLIANQIRVGIEDQIRMIDDRGQETAIFKKLTQRKVHNVSHEETLKRKKEYCYRYMIHAVSIVAALTHDIGYPVAYMLRTTEKLHSFLPLSEAFLHLNDAMPHLNEILQGSLLYQTVGSQQIAKRIKEKKDHGAISAVILLSKYYETGAIYHLEPIEKMVIELSAVVIYNHTLKYDYMTGKTEQNYRNMFEDDPISYLFRWCDDIQEWGRVYFDISKKSNFLICPHCHMPISRERENRKSAVPIRYSCACGATGVRRTQFPYRKMTNISACRALEITETVCPAGGQRRLKISMEYDLISLLQLSLYNPQFAKQRADGVYEVKRMLNGQKIIPTVYIDTFLTNNPIAIKVRCLERYLWQVGDGSGKKGIWRKKDMMAVNAGAIGKKHAEKNILNRIKRKFLRTGMEWDYPQAGSVLKNVCKAEGWKYSSKKQLWLNIRQKWEQNIGFYYLLLIIGINIAEFRKNGYLLDRDKAIVFANQLADAVAVCYNIMDRYTVVLIMDYIWQTIRNVTEDEFYNDTAHHYYEEAMLSNQAMIYAVEEYVESDTYNMVKRELYKRQPGDLKGVYDFYTDYELFSAMAQHSEL